MKGEIFRRMSMEIIKDEGVELPIPIKRELEKDRTEEEDDYLVKTIGAFGLWQAVVFVAVTLTRAIAMWNLMSIPFLSPVVEFICVKFSDNVTTQVNVSTCYDNCVQYNYSSVFGRSIIEDFGLICQNAWLASFMQSVLIIGVLVGAWIFGWISDRFGRRTALLISTFLSAVFMIALPFSPSYIIFTFIRFIIGVGSGGSLTICIVQVMEIIGKKYREIAGACSLIPDGLAQASLAGFAYFTSTWQGFTLGYGMATCLIFIVILFIPESPRWLVSHGKVDEAIKVITRAATRNNLDTSNIEAEVTKAVEDMKLKDCKIMKPSYLDFFKSKSIFILTLTLFFIWLVMGICYYGIYQYVTIIGVDPYLTVVMIGLIPIPFFPVGIIINMKFGRKISSFATAIVITTAMLILIFVPRVHWLGTMLGIMAFICCYIFLTIHYIYLSELYPTPLRNMSIALTSSAAKIGGMIAPFIAILSPRWLPSLFFCILPILGGLCCLTLPETKGRNLKDTITK